MRCSIVMVTTALLMGCLLPEDFEGTGGGSGGGDSGGTGGSSGGTGGGGTGGGGSTGSLCSTGFAAVTSDTTWSGAIDLTCDATVSSGAVLTLAAGTTVRVSPGKAFKVTGGLKVEGTTAAPVTMSAVAGPWSFSFDTGPGKTLSLRNVTISGAGDSVAAESSLTLGAGVFADLRESRLFVENVTVSGASGIGLVMVTGAFADGSSNLRIQGSGSYPLFVKAGALTSIPAGSSFAGNAKDGVVVETAFTTRFSAATRLITSGTIRKFDVPYIIGLGAVKTDLIISTVESGPPTFTNTPVITIEAGVELRFSKVRDVNSYQSLINIDSAPDNGVWKPLGTLRAIGTAAAPIVFTSNEQTPAAGDWATIALEELSAQTQLDHVVIAYAGADARALGACNTGAPSGGGSSPVDGDAALQVFMHGASGPGHNPLTNSEILDSAGSGVYRAWDQNDLDMTAGNTFTRIAWCRQTPIIVGTMCSPMTCN